MASAHATLIADMNDAPYMAAVKRMDRSMEAFALESIREFSKVDRAHADLSSKMARRLGGGRGQGAYRTGQVALQVQDVAVQAQMGVGASRILLQQGTQLASIFGPKGQIFAGLLSLGALTYDWYSSMTKVTQEAERQQKVFEARRKEVEELMSNVAKAEDEGNKAARQRLFGDDEADRLQRLEDHQRKMLDIANKGGGKFARDAETERFQQVERLIEERKQKEIDAARVIEKEKIRSAEREAAASRRITEGESGGNALMRMAKEFNEARQKRDGSGGGLPWAEANAEMEKIQSEMTTKARDINTAHQKEFMKGAEAASEAAKRLADSVKSSFHDAFKELKKEADKAFAEVTAKAKAERLMMGQRLLNRADEILDPAGAKQKERDDKKRDRAIRRAAEEEVEEADRNVRKRGLRGLTPAQRRKLRDDKIDAANEKLKRDDTTKIDPADITKLAEAIARENAKLIAK